MTVAAVDGTLLVELLVTGLIMGSAYALAAAGLSFIYGVMGVINMSHGELYMAGAFVAYVAVAHLGLSYLAALALAVVGLSLGGLLLYDGLLVHLGDRGQLERGIVLTIGVSLILQNGAIAVFGAAPRTFETDLTANVYDLAGIRLAAPRLFALVAAAAAFLVLYVLLQRTNRGRAMRGTAQNPSAALMVGLNPRAISRTTAIVGCALAGLAGAALAFVFSVNATMGLAVLFKAFAIIIIGGLGSMAGTVVTALGLGVVESYAGGLTSTTIQDAVAFGSMMLVLFLRPQGLFGREVRL